MKHPNAWKKYGALALAAVLTVGTCVQTGMFSDGTKAVAEETQETQRTTLNIINRNDPEEETTADADDAPTDTADTADDATTDTADAADDAAADVADDATMDAADAAITDTADTDDDADEADSEQTEESERVSLNLAGATLEDLSDAETEETQAAAAEEAAAEEQAEEEAAAEEQAQASVSLGTTASVSSGLVATDVSEVVESVLPAFVAIVSKSDSTETTGSGIILAQNDTELLIATDSEVVADADEIVITFCVEGDEEALSVSARLKASDSASMLAVVAVQLDEIDEEVLGQLKVAALGSSDAVKVGSSTIAIGNAMGYGLNVTLGIVSAVNRTVSVDGVSMDFLVTDAAVNPGSGGGALLNAAGEVIGIIVGKETDSAENMGYAVPIDTAIPVLETLMNKETREKLTDATRGYIGASVTTVSDDAIETYGFPAGAYVVSVNEGSAAETAGIRQGDVIAAFEGETVTTSDELIQKMSYYAPGETVTLLVYTSNNGTFESREVEVTLQETTTVAEEEEEETDEAAVEEEDAADEYTMDEDEWSEFFEYFFGSDDSDGYYYYYGDDSDSYGFDDGFSDGFEDYNSQFH